MADTHAAHAVEIPEAKVDTSKIRKVSLIAAVAGFAGYAIFGAINNGADSSHGLRDFFMAYLCGFVFWACVPFGSLGLSMIGYLTQASWGIVLRRVIQASIRTLPILFVI